MVRQRTDEYETAGFASGCPVAAATVDCASSGTSTREAAAAAFTAWRGPVAEALTEMGVPADRAEPLATLMISALEGAILMARAERDVRPLTTVARELGRSWTRPCPRPDRGPPDHRAIPPGRRRC